MDYIYEGCDRVFTVTKIEKISGYDIKSTNIGNWNINIHHAYNIKHGYMFLHGYIDLYIYIFIILKFIISFIFIKEDII